MNQATYYIIPEKICIFLTFIRAAKIFKKNKLQPIITGKSSPVNSLNGVNPLSTGYSFKINTIYQEMETPNS